MPAFKSGGGIMCIASSCRCRWSVQRISVRVPVRKCFKSSAPHRKMFTSNASAEKRIAIGLFTVEGYKRSFISGHRWLQETETPTKGHTITGKRSTERITGSTERLYQSPAQKINSIMRQHKRIKGPKSGTEWDWPARGRIGSPRTTLLRRGTEQATTCSAEGGEQAATHGAHGNYWNRKTLANYNYGNMAITPTITSSYASRICDLQFYT